MRALRINPTTNTITLTCRIRDNGGFSATNVFDDEICEYMLMEARTHTVVVYVEVEQISGGQADVPSAQAFVPTTTSEAFMPIVRDISSNVEDHLHGHNWFCERRIHSTQQLPRAEPRRSAVEHPSWETTNYEQAQNILPSVASMPRNSQHEPYTGEHADGDRDEVEGYETMNSSSSNSSDEDSPRLYSQCPMEEFNNTECNGQGYIEDHATQNCDGLDGMNMNNEFVETVRTTQQWDDDENFDAPCVNIVSPTEATSTVDLYEGQIFHTKVDLQAAINGWSILHNVQFLNSTSNKIRLSIMCAQHDNVDRPCLWRLHASRSKRLGGLWKISTCDPSHTCTHPILASGHHNCTAKFICRLIIPIIRQQLDMKPKEIVARMESKFDIKISYMKAWDARRKAIEATFGSYEQSYRSLFCFMEALRLSQPGSVYSIHVVAPTRFKGLFWAFGASICGWEHCRPVLSMDGTFLLGKYRGTLLAAVGIDGNGGLFPLAFAVVESESNESWIWFLQKLQELVPTVVTREKLCIVSDKHPRLVRGFREVFPNAVHRHCLRHLRENFKKMVRRLGTPDSEGLSNKMYFARNTDDYSYFNRMMDEIKMIKQDTFDWLVQRDVSKWSLLFDEGHRYGIITTNASECFNGVLKRARGLPIQGLIMSIYYNLVALFLKRSAEAQKWVEEGQSPFVPRTMIVIQRAERDARRYPEPVTINRNEFEVIDTSSRANKVEITNAASCTCTCLRPQLYHVPCVHVVAVAGARRWDHNAFVSPIFTIENYIATYSKLFHVFPPKDIWPTFNEEHGLIPLLAPAFRRRAGRPRMNRFRNTMDEPSSCSNKACGFCKQTGHNRSTCMADRSRRARSGRRTSQRTADENVPRELSIASLGESHRAHDPDHASPLVASSHMRMAREWPIDCPRMIYVLTNLGLHNLRHLQFIRLDHNLIQALVERWCPITNTFHLTIGEMTITLQDVQILLGLRIDGPAVVGPNVVGQGRIWPTWSSCCDELLGSHPGRETVYHDPNDEEDVATFRMGSSQIDSMLPLRWLRWTFYRESYDDLAPEIFLRHVRAYILFMIDCFLIPDTSRSHVSLQWLPLLADVDSFSRMSLGGAVLAHLYRELCFDKANEDIYSRMCCTPTRRPLGCRWAEDRIRELPAGNTMTYRDEFDGLRMSQVIMTPYTQAVLANLPLQFHDGQEIWRARVPLISWKRAEWHLPDRVVRQFSGMPTTDIEPMDPSFRRIDGRGRADQDWTIQYRDYLHIWEERRA
ncbi:hypothetical protein KFK09_008858 [Dendrobium nobile]|uniref:SWIM-type domain-containing protein n=1 Tax=Dendrobium nobile TaxID=94219 RepID=A0A8T3BQR9_DENNO|nr:hypothetical protein KFK09_008858 [Dendrobium nobile]